MWKIEKFEIHGDKNGSLIALDCHNLPFVPKRIFYMFDTKEGICRGFHAHKAGNQILICTSGSCRIVLDDGKKKESFILDSPDTGLYVPCHYWREMDEFSSGTVLMVIADTDYNEEDYIRNYEDFLEYYHQRY